MRVSCLKQFGRGSALLPQHTDAPFYSSIPTSVVAVTSHLCQFSLAASAREKRSALLKPLFHLCSKKAFLTSPREGGALADSTLFFSSAISLVLVRLIRSSSKVISLRPIFSPILERS